jgi:hypothetical protein
MATPERPGCLGQFLQALGLQPKSAAAPSGEETPLPYRLAEPFASPAELSFYHVLRQVVGNDLTVFSKVSLGDLFYPQTGDRGQNAVYRNKIDRKHVDFLLCEPRTLRPLAGIELDDISHQREDRVARDRFVERVFETAGLPLVRFPVQADYSLEEIRTRLQSSGLLKNVTTVAPVSPPPAAAVSPSVAVPVKPEATPPLCPKCGIPMVLRTVTQEGPHKGKQFYGCPNYPRCREVAPVKSS